MSFEERFIELWNNYLEGELNESDVSELRELMNAHPDFANLAADSYETHRLLSLIMQDTQDEREAFIGATMAKLPADQNQFVGSVVKQIMPTKPSASVGIKKRFNTRLYAVAASIVIVILVGIVVSLMMSKTEIVQITGIHGLINWTGDGGQINRDLIKGQMLSGGTLETVTTDSWAELTFKDGSKITITGQSALTITENKRKELHLRHGNLSASVTPQPAGKPMLIHTPTAELEVLGTQFNVNAELSSTLLLVNEGKVRVKRLADGSVTDVPADYQVSADASRQANFKSTPRLKYVHAWKSNLPQNAIYGDWISKSQSIKAKPLLWRIDKNNKKKSILLYLAAMAVSRGKQSPIALVSGTKIRIQGHMDKQAHLVMGLTNQYLKGGFAGKYNLHKPPKFFSKDGGDFDFEVRIEDFKPEEPQHPASPIGHGLYDFWCLTINDDAGLRITSVELIPSNSDPIKESLSSELTAMTASNPAPPSLHHTLRAHPNTDSIPSFPKPLLN